MNITIRVSANLVLSSLAGFGLSKIIDSNPQSTIMVTLASTVTRMAINYFLEKRKLHCCTKIPPNTLRNLTLLRHGILHALQGSLATGGLLVNKVVQNFDFKTIAGVFAYTSLTDYIICLLTNRFIPVTNDRKPVVAELNFKL